MDAKDIKNRILKIVRKNKGTPRLAVLVSTGIMAKTVTNHLKAIDKSLMMGDQFAKNKKNKGWGLIVSL